MRRVLARAVAAQKSKQRLAQKPEGDPMNPQLCRLLQRARGMSSQQGKGPHMSHSRASASPGYRRGEETSIKQSALDSFVSRGLFAMQAFTVGSVTKDIG